MCTRADPTAASCQLYRYWNLPGVRSKLRSKNMPLLLMTTVECLKQ
jgi:hypothetical protein